MIVAGFQRVSAKVYDLVPCCPKLSNQILLYAKPTMIRGDSDPHAFSLVCRSLRLQLPSSRPVCKH